VTIRLGITGGIGSGKSTVAALLQAQGAYLIDADAISRATTAPGGSAMPEIAAVFGPEMLSPDGGLDRAAMRSRVFAHAESREKLQSIVHPLVATEIDRQLQSPAAAAAHLIVLDIPLLVESPTWRSRLDRVLVVDCHPQTQVQRVAQRSGLSIDAIRGIMKAQANRSQRLRAADAVIHNDGLNLKQLTDLVRKIGQEFGL